MRHHKKTRTLSRKTGQRKALLKALGVSLVSKEKIMTTEAKAKELRPFIERLMTHAKKGTLAGRRHVVAALGPKAGNMLVDKIAPRYKERAGGYTRITKVMRRLQDGAPRAVIEFV